MTTISPPADVSLVRDLSSLCPRTTPNPAPHRITGHHDGTPETGPYQHRSELHGMRHYITGMSSSPPSDTYLKDTSFHLYDSGLRPPLWPRSVNAATAASVLDRLRAGDVTESLPAVPDPVAIGMGQSYGGLLLTVLQAEHPTFAGVAMLGWSGICTTVSTGDLGPGEVMARMQSNTGLDYPYRPVFHFEDVPDDIVADVDRPTSSSSSTSSSGSSNGCRSRTTEAASSSRAACSWLPSTNVVQRQTWSSWRLQSPTMPRRSRLWCASSSPSRSTTGSPSSPQVLRAQVIRDADPYTGVRIRCRPASTGPDIRCGCSVDAHGCPVRARRRRVPGRARCGTVLIA